VYAGVRLYGGDVGLHCVSDLGQEFFPEASAGVEDGEVVWFEISGVY